MIKTLIIEKDAMAVQQYLLTEWVRVIEQHVVDKESLPSFFGNHPDKATETLRDKVNPNFNDVERLHKRAQIIDRDGILTRILESNQYRLQMVRRIALFVWFVLGCLTTYGLMEHTNINFFLILIGVLGVNTVMLLMWCSTTFLLPLFKSLTSQNKRVKTQQNDNLILQTILKSKLTNDVHNQDFNEEERKTLSTTLNQVYSMHWKQPYIVWYRHAFMHKLALMALLGMCVAMLFLLVVRQYHFNWQSTLLSNETLEALIGSLGWLPSIVGFDVPTMEAIAAARNGVLNNGHSHAAASFSGSWAGLLLGSLICYGIVPRLMVWIGCTLRCSYIGWQNKARTQLQAPTSHKTSNCLEINVKQQYYQNIIHAWQTTKTKSQIVDGDADYRPDDVIMSNSFDATAEQPLVLNIQEQVTLNIVDTKEDISQDEVAAWAILLEAVDKQTNWHHNVLAQEWLDCGIITSRHDVTNFQQRLHESPIPIQLLVGVRANVVPDRGLMRIIGKLAHSEQVKFGLIVKLINHDNNTNTSTQWKETLNQNGIAWIE